MAEDINVRRATVSDLTPLGRLGAVLIQTHYDFDRQRFLPPGDNPETGYAAFLRSQLGRRDAAVLVAERNGAVMGYVYAAIEPHSWKELRDRAGFVHDLVVDEGARRSGVARALMAAALEWLRETGVPRVVLGTAYQNERARQLFASLGFRPTMVEMTREL
jgi:ribosomal protein S18 acetylase RimI-like enzyme